MTTMQLPLSFAPGLTVQFPEWEDVLAAAVYGSRKSLNGVAADLDMAPTDLSRRLNRAHKGDGERDTRPLTAAHAIGIVKSTGDKRPVFWLVEKFLSDPEATRNQAIDQLAQVLPMIIELAAQAGLTTKTKAR